MKRSLISPALVRRDFLKNGLLGLAALMAPPLAGCSSDESDDASGGKGGGAGSGGSGGGSGGSGAGGGTGGTGTGGTGTGGTGGTGGSPNLSSNIANLGELGAADANGIRLPAGFTSRIVARTGQPAVAGKSYNWHGAPDGGAVFPTDDGGWIYVSNSELPFIGGVGALRFDKDGTLVDSYPIASGTNVNCAGGKTPWGTWLTCEEVPGGRVLECDPTGAKPAVALPALGIFKHEAVAVDPGTLQLYLTEDEGDGRFYRFTPASVAGGVPDLTSGKLEVAQVGADDKVVWHEVLDPSGNTRNQVAESTPFKRGEGIAYFDGVVHFTTTSDNRVWSYDIQAQTLTILYDRATSTNPILSGVDNVAVTCCGDVLVAEDGGDMQIVAILPDGTLKPLLQIEGQPDSEITGPAFDASGTRLYLSSQRAPGGALTYEITGPFHLAAS